jgi:hypothetical protein
MFWGVFDADFLVFWVFGGVRFFFIRGVGSVMVLLKLLIVC